MGVFAERLGARIKQLREERGLGVSALARATRVTRQALYNIEAGRALPGLEHVTRLARALGCDELDLMCWPDAHPRHAVAELLRGRSTTTVLTARALAEKILGKG